VATHFNVIPALAGRVPTRSGHALVENPLPRDSAKLSESLVTGTYRDPKTLYKPMINAFSRAIAKYTEGESDEKV
jgi:hypothetical protein